MSKLIGYNSFRKQKKQKKENDMKLVISKVPGQLVADKTMVKINWSGSVSIGVEGNYYIGPYYEAKLFIKGNDIFNPGHDWNTTNAVGLGQYAAFYKQYCVLASQCCVEWTAYSSEISLDYEFAPSAGVLYPSNLALTPSAKFDYVRSLPNASEVDFCQGPGWIDNYAIIGPPEINSAIKSTGKVEHFITTSRVFGKDDIQADSDMCAPLTGGPTKPWFWNFILSSPGFDGNEVFEVIVNVKMTYYVSLYDLKLLQ